MNPMTRVAVHCYAGDGHQVESMLPLYLHHGCPVTILSPENSKFEITGDPLVTNRFGGKRCAIGQDALDRQRAHLRLLLDFDEEYFLIHDSDSVCLSPRLPTCLYDEPDILWSNLLEDKIAHQQKFYPPDFPHIAFQPPWFMSRKTIEAMLARVALQNLTANPGLSYIDYWLVELALEVGRAYRGLPGAMSLPLSDNAECRTLGLDRVRNHGDIFIHALKGMEHAAPFVEARAAYVKDHPDE